MNDKQEMIKTNEKINLKLIILLATAILVFLPIVYATNIHSFFGTFYPANGTMIDYKDLFEKMTK